MSQHPDPRFQKLKAQGAEPRCRHNQTWVMCGGYLYWCYECGAVRQAQRSQTVNGGYPVGPWIKPVGKGGENPADKLKK